MPGDKQPGDIPPPSKNLPSHAQEILASTYKSCRMKWAGEYPNDKENQDNKKHCAEIAWGAVHAQYKKDGENWVKKIKAFEEIVFELQCFKKNISENEILQMIEPAKLSEIKKQNEHPIFNVYSVAHEGTYRPHVIGEGAQSISWGRKAIQSIKDIILKGVKFFVNHNKDNSTANRSEVAEVVGDKQEEIDGKLHHLVCAYFPKAEDAEKYDIISQESIWDVIKEGGRLIADKIKEMTGIACSSSDIDKPAFDNAVKLGTLQCFEDNNISFKEKEFLNEIELKKKIFYEDEILRNKL